MPPAKRVTITEIARLCGVSAQTVSRVINHRPDVSEATRVAVEEAIANFGYRPSALARGLVRQRSQMLGVVVGGLKHFGVSQILNGIAEESQEAGYGLLLREIVDVHKPDLAPVIDQLVSHQVEGIIFAAPPTDWTVDLASQLPRYCPTTVFLKRGPSPGHTTIGIDNHRGAVTAVEHLLALGRERIAHVSGPHPWLEARLRRVGWEDTVRRAGLSDRLVTEGNWSSGSGQTAFAELLERHGAVDAVFVANDQMALGVMREATRRGMRVPQDLAVIGFDNVPDAEQFTPALTTVAQPLAAIGRSSVRRLLLEISGEGGAEPGADIVMPTELIIRESAPAVPVSAVTPR